MQALPGFGKQKAQIFVALLAKQLDVRPDGWERVVGDYAGGLPLRRRRRRRGVPGQGARFKKEKKAAAQATALSP